MSSPKTVAIIGGGPVGLAAAAHALGRGLTPVVLEAGDSAGHAVRQWSHVRMFSPWTYNVDKAAGALLREEGWNSPEPDRYPFNHPLKRDYIIKVDAPRMGRRIGLDLKVPAGFP
jgi:2-polyprenyl-6-methoxyphenol hydroxylase-like FAD-dependent oxidoreductase